ncbi:MAG: ornithine decarboxylase [Acidiphilium sp. 37-64-53]|uniref:type III PLP-dependent enzyme n=1 Tax=Acidiphilium TaxID=522 RepID=UPI000BCF6E4E|nr:MULTISPECIES: type III PLP-dependent enzyme [Acidiphilium]OYW01061.1 MAG: ornithine decarboxylase [Acidiphilium sp. 37-64-53]OZB24658.1 MAG: ornithine decarboxylase [Acidiphilium sp. 34-64-41]HQT86816.1 type III PLP-dependent enzyme [Acidiphilium rubrum]
MTPKLARFIDSGVVATPAILVDLDRVAANFAALRAALPDAAIYYAVKANPAAPVLDRLVGLGSRFDAASIEEIRACLAAGAAPSALSFGNTVKKRSAIAEAFARGVDLFAFDSDEELAKIAAAAPGAKVYCRLAVSQDGADWPLSRKFGTTGAHARDLLLAARDLGLVAHGVSFHVGSQQTGVGAYQTAIGQAAMVFSDLRARGIDLRLLNLGGGFPTRYREDIPSIAAFGDAIMASVRAAFGNDLPDLLIEPGRAVVGDAGVAVSEVVLACNRREDDDRRWVYLDIGRFGGLAETEGEAIRYAISAPGVGGDEAPAVLAGPSCDGVDVMYRETPYRLPAALKSGDRVLIHDTGAYVTSYASQGFNGFLPPQEHYL